MVTETVPIEAPPDAKQLAEETLAPTQPDVEEAETEATEEDDSWDKHLPTFAEREDFKAWQEQERKVARREGHIEGQQREAD